MRAIVQTAYGNSTVLALEDRAVPKPRPGEVLVKVHACGVNASDIEFMTGSPVYTRMLAPRGPRRRVLGSDISGIVVEIGAGVENLVPGEAVAADLLGLWGGFAEFVVAPAKKWVPVPKGLSHNIASSVLQPGVIVLQAFGSRLATDTRVLINGAGGSTGTLAVRLAKAAGAHVTAVDHGDKFDFLRRLGADQVIDYRIQDYTSGASRYDLIIDLVARKPVWRNRRILADGGTYLLVGGTLRMILTCVVAGPTLSLLGSRKSRLLAVNSSPQRLALALQMAADGALSPVIDSTWSLEKVPAAMQFVADGRAQGRVVITPDTT